MPRPVKCRKVHFRPGFTWFKPAGIPVKQLDEAVLTIDELEALRLADLEGLYQEDAASRMKVSRQTFGNIVESARRKTADALINGKAIRIEGGNVELKERIFACGSCGHEWSAPCGTGRPEGCPACGGERFCRKQS